MHFELCNNCTQYVLDPGLILQGSVLVLVLGLGTKVLGLGLASQVLVNNTAILPTQFL